MLRTTDKDFVEVNTEIKFTPKYPIGTEFWFLSENKIKHGLICDITVKIIAATDGDGLFHSLWKRFNNGLRGEIGIYDYAYGYGAKVWNYQTSYYGGVTTHGLNRTKCGFYLDGLKIYFDKDELINSIK